MAQSANIQIWKDRIHEYRSTGQTAVVWCAARNISVSTLRYWITKINKESKSTPQEWVSISNITGGSKPITVRIGDILIEVPDDSNVATLRNIFKALGVA